ncbi:MAG TPA: 16S rRNA (adenine(1518)-N(6)/adenine(1519)-N(6))-dimethyltransferase RsmA [Granulicella sp.]
MKQKSKLGQNFLIDERARHAIAEALGDVHDRTVIEIGPGHGAITDILATRCGRLIAVEFDAKLAAELRERFAGQPQVEIVQADILRTDLLTLIPEGDTADVIGNLPYYITSDILLHLFATAGRLRRAVVMMQREVAERVAAEPGGREYGVLSATAQMYAEVENLFTLPPGSFSPPPEVFSTVLRLHFRPRFEELGVDAAGFDAFLKQSFAQKRKTLANNLRAAGYTPEQLTQSWPEAIPAQARSESIGLEAMAAFYRALTAG